MNIILIGIQGSGKGTQAKLLSKKLNIPHISTGDIFRSITGKLKEKVDATINQGKLLPDDLTMDIIKDRISKPDCKNGFILDGSPRNVDQAKMLDKITRIDKVIEISLEDKESIRRLSGRRSCKSCDKEYNINIPSLAPKEKEKCDTCHKPLFQREDDKTEIAIKKRLEIYHKDTQPILKHYKSIKVNGNQPIDDVFKDILEALR
jgi:adenylate kinase